MKNKFSVYINEYNWKIPIITGYIRWNDKNKIKCYQCGPKDSESPSASPVLLWRLEEECLASPDAIFIIFLDLENKICMLAEKAKRKQ